MGIYRGAGGTGDAVNDASSEATLVQELVNGATTQANNAATSATAAQAASTQAAISQGLAADSATAAASSASSASSSASTATTQATNAATSATAAQTAQTAAELAETNAETAETNAETAASQAATSATNASNSASAASTSATNASNSATAAATSATNASNSASAASTSASNASTSATAAAGSASSASTSASNASTSATNAANSATSASTSATTATTQAGIATTQATNAASSASAASTSATNASNSASTATTQATNASSSASSAATSATNAAASYDAFDDRYLGSKSSAPTLDNDGNALLTGALYFDTTSSAMKVYNGSAWLDAYASLSGALIATNNLSDLNNTATARTNLGVAIGTNVQAWDADLDTWATKTAPTGTVVGTSDTQTLTNKTLTSPVVTGGSINNTPVGASTASTGRFTTLEATGVTTVQAGTVSAPAITTTGDTNTGIFFPAADTIAFTEGGVEAMRIDSSANVGLGTSSPVTRLHLDITGSNAAAATSVGTFQINHAGITGLVGSSGIEFKCSTFGSGYGSKLTAFDDGSLIIANRANSATWSERMRITSAGDVGIGTSSPSYKLEVNGSNPTAAVRGNALTNVSVFSAEASDYATSFRATRILQHGSSATGTTFGLSNASLGYIVFQNTSVGAIGTNGGTPLVFATASTERMRIDSSGNVGIGAAPTTNRLSVSGNIALLSNGELRLADAGNSSVSTIKNSGATTVSQMEFYTASTERMRIDASGNVGIGTSSPGARLNIVDSTSNDALRITQTGTGNALLVEDSANPDGTPFVIDSVGIVVAGYTSSIQTSRTDGATFNNSYIQANGNIANAGYSAVGFGTAINALGAQLRLARSNTTTIGARGAVIANSGLGAVSFQGDDGTNYIQAAKIEGFVDGTPGTDDMPGRLVFSTTADGSATPTERMRIDASGNVGIGTSSPDAKLTVNGVASFGDGAAATPSITNFGDLNTGFWFPAADTIAASTNGTEALRIDSAGLLQFNSGYGSVATAYGCRAWVNFNGTTNVGGFCTIRASGNVSSIADNGTGNYTVNFTTAMPDANYSVCGTAKENDNNTLERVLINPFTFTTSNFGLRVASTGTPTAIDPPICSLAIFR